MSRNATKNDKENIYFAFTYMSAWKIIKSKFSAIEEKRRVIKRILLEYMELSLKRHKTRTMVKIY